MKAVIVTKHGGPDNMEIQEVSMPTPGPNEICQSQSRLGYYDFQVNENRRNNRYGLLVP